MIETLKDTVELMNSEDYIDIIAEYKQLVVRKAILDKWDKNELSFKPSCLRSTYDLQIKAMADYFNALEARAVMERVESRLMVE